jgi:uncharacterized repeat protein (TIGR01451 family)/fimbrial isopeptide formation D2 family protein
MLMTAASLIRSLVRAPSRRSGQLSLLALLALVSVFVSVVVSSPASAAGGTPVILTKSYSGNIDYAAVGASFRSTTNNCDFFNPMTTTVTLNIPVGANVIEALLYYSGSADIGPNYHTEEIDLSDQTNLTLNGVAIPTTPSTQNDKNFPNLTALGSGVVDFFGARRDVTDIVTGPGAYTLSGLVVHRENQGRPATGTCLGAWGLVVIYEDPAIDTVRVINVFDGFQDFKNSTFDLQPQNFVVGVAATAGKMTHMTFEGDPQITGNEQFQLQIGSGPFVAQSNGLNPLNNQYNSTVTGPDVFDTNTSYGFDLDSYDMSSQLIGQANEFTAVTRYNAGTDLVLLMAEVILIDNKPLADIEITLTDIGLFDQNTADGAQYVIHVENNGDGLTIPSTGFATGYVHVYDDLPAGIDITSLSDITAPGWDCSGTDLLANQVRCRYDLSTLAGGQLNRGESLPDITIIADVGNITGSVTNRAYATLCNSAIDTCTTFDEKHTDADQFDQINFFEDFEDLFDILVKSDVNNNVDRVVSPIIVGAPSDLSTSTKSVVDLNSGTVDAGDLLEYTITLNETAGELASNVEITDIIDTDLTSFAFQSTSCGGTPSTDFSFGIFTISGLTVSANSSCDVVFRATIKASAVAGTLIDNTANIANGTGVDGEAIAPTLLVAGTAEGSKVLYFDNVSSTPILTRQAPVANTSTQLNNGQSLTLNLSPVLAADLDINSGVIPVSVWIEGTVTSGSTYSVTADVSYPGGVNITSDTISGVSLTAGTPSAVAQLFPFQLGLPSNITDFTTGEALSLQITNNSPNPIVIHSLINNTDSIVIVDAADVINVDEIKFFDDVSRSPASEIIDPDTIDSGDTIYIEATVSDPFGFADITGASLTLIDPLLANQLSNVAMSEVSGAGATKVYVYAYDIPDAASIDPGVWVAQVTAFEGNEGTVTHTNANSFTTAAPEVSVAYTVNQLTRSPGNSLTYSMTIENSGGPTTLSIDQAIPNLTQNLVDFTGLPPGTVNTSTSSNINLSFDAPGGTTTISFVVTVVAGAQPGDIIDHTISLDNMGSSISDVAPSVLIDPFSLNNGNKPLYADAFNTVRRFDRTAPNSNTSTAISSQGGNTLFTLSPVLQGDLTLASGDIVASIWISRGNTSFAGQRVVQATLGYTGAANGTIGTDSVTVQLGGGEANAQYIPFTINLASPLTIPANTSLTLRLTNNTSVAGETITAHTLKNSEPSLISLNADNPLDITAIEFFTDSVDTVNPGTPITGIMPSSNVWVRATISDPFGREDITSADISIENPAAVETQSSTAMSIPSAQPSSPGEKYYEFNYTLGSDLGDWTVNISTTEGNEGLVSDSDSAAINVNNNVSDLSTSYKYVVNTTTGENANTNPGDTLRYTIELVNSGLGNANNVGLTDSIPANTTFVTDSLFVDGVLQPNPGDPITLSGLAVPAGTSLTVSFDVIIDGGVSIGTLISNTADITDPGGASPNVSVDAEDLVIAGPPASGTKLLYLEDLNGTPFLTRLEPQTSGTTDRIELQNGGGSVTLDLTPALTRDITLDPADGDILITLRMQSSGQNNRNRNTTVSLGYQDGGAVTSIGNVTQNVNLNNNINDYVFSIPVSAVTTIPAGNALQLTITNNQGNNNRDMFIYSFDSGANRSTVALVPNPVINVDSITFWSGPGMTGTQVNNPNPSSNVDIYAHIVVSDPFGENDIQAFDAATNASSIVITDPDNNVSDGGTNQSCTAPCYAYVGEVADADAGTKSFDYLIRLSATPPASRGTWTVQVTANEGLEGDISHTQAATFTTALGANLATSTKQHNVVGDVTSGTQFTYTITINNSGALDADDVTFTDTLETSPVNLSFVSASTTCLDETDSPLPNPSFAGGDVTLTNISVAATSSCQITVTVSAGSGTPGDLINNVATLVNPGGIGGTPAAPTIIYEESQIPVAGSKQLYLDALNSTTVLSRTQPNSADNITLDENFGVDDIILDLDNVTTRAMSIATGTIDVNLLLSESGNGRNRQTEVQLLVDTDANGSFETELGEQQLNLSLDGTPSIRTFTFTNNADIPIVAGASFRLIVRNNQNQNNRVVILHQSASAPYSEVVVPLINPLEVTSVGFYDRSATDDSVTPGCAATFSCGTLQDPAFVQAGKTIWIRATAADGFGSADVNTGCDGVTSTNCPTVTTTNPNGGTATSDLVYVNAPDISSRQYELEITPGGINQDGIWAAEVEFTEGVEGIIFDTGVNTFERITPAILLVVKSASGTTNPGDVVTFSNEVTHTDGSRATNVALINRIGNFVALELVNDGGSWTALLSLSNSFTFINEAFDDDLDDGNGFNYDPNTTGVCALPAASPCYDSAIRRWRIELVEDMPIGGSVTQEYRGLIE